MFSITKNIIDFNRLFIIHNGNFRGRSEEVPAASFSAAAAVQERSAAPGTETGDAPTSEHRSAEMVTTLDL